MVGLWQQCRAIGDGILRAELELSYNSDDQIQIRQRSVSHGYVARHPPRPRHPTPPTSANRRSASPPERHSCPRPSAFDMSSDSLKRSLDDGDEASDSPRSPPSLTTSSGGRPQFLRVPRRVSSWSTVLQSIYAFRKNPTVNTVSKTHAPLSHHPTPEDRGAKAQQGAPEARGDMDNARL